MSLELWAIVVPSTIAIGALWWSIRAGKGAAVSAAAAQAAAERSAEAVERLALASETQALAAERSAERPSAAWKLEYYDGDTYIWENVGRSPAFDVEVTAPELGLQARDVSDVAGKPQRRLQGEQTDPIQRQMVRPGETIRFLTVLTLDIRDDSVTVTWRNDRDAQETQTFSRPLPPRPRTASR